MIRQRIMFALGVLFGLFVLALPALLVFVLTSCAQAKAPLPPLPTNDLARPSVAPPLPEAPTNDSDARQREADARVAKIEGDLAEAKRLAKQEREAGERKTREAIHAVITWACAMAALVGIVGAGVAVVLRSKTLAIVPVAAVVMVAVGQTTSAVVEHPWLTVGGLGCLVALIAVTSLRKRAEALIAKVGA